MIIKATYGNKDVTKQVMSMVKDGKLLVKAGNDVFGDPSPGIYKHLVIESEHGHFSAPENSYLQIPASTNRKLGIFYTNNNDDKVVKESLMTLTKFDHVADILTCSWRPIEGNPFYEARAISQTPSHVNIIIQILQLLYTAREYGKYEYVSFLEHDVLYPEGYFDFPEFTEGALVNSHFKGLCVHGWQERTTDFQLPLHQMTLRFNDAITHFEQLILKGIERRSVEVEPLGNQKTWRCVNPAVHVNHGKHFTSHFSIYNTTSFDAHDAYWGPASEWIAKLF